MSSIEWIEDDYAKIHSGTHIFGVRTSPKSTIYKNARLYVGGPKLAAILQTGTTTDMSSWVKEHCIPAIESLLSRKLHAKYSKYAGCTCGCTPGFVLQRSEDIPFDLTVYIE